jgi:hypothetical protein
MNCYEATQLISRQLDEPLPLRNQAGLKIHLMICTSCTNFNHNMHFLRLACGQLAQVEANAPTSSE